MTPNVVLLMFQNGSGIAGPLAPYVPLLMIFFGIVILVLVIRGIAGRYIKVPPDKALVMYGMGRTHIVTGGAAIAWPFVYDYYLMDLRADQAKVALSNVPNSEKIQVTVEAEVMYKIGNTPELLNKAAENFGDSDNAESQQKKEDKVKLILSGHLRSAIGTLSLEKLLSERDEFNSSIQNQSAREMEELGLQIKNFNILNLSDEAGVIDALARKATATILADATIEKAEQEKRQTIETTNAQKEGATTKAQNEAMISAAERDRDKQQLIFKADVARQEALTDQAGPLSKAESRRAVVQAEVEVEKARAEAEIGLQDSIQKKNEAQLRATRLTEAEAEKKRVLIQAEGEAAARVRTADAAKQAAEMEGEGTARKELAIGTAAADVTQKKGLAQAEVNKQTGLADAEVTRQKGLAEAEAQKARLLAEADGTRAALEAQAEGRRKLVDAFASMDPEQRKLFLTMAILDRLPESVRALGEAGSSIMKPIADAVTASLANIDNLTVFDSAQSAGGDNALSRLMKVGPGVLFESAQQLKALGLIDTVQGVARLMGIDPSLIPSSNGKEKESPAVISPAVPAAASPAAPAAIEGQASGESSNRRALSADGLSTEDPLTV